MKKIYRFLLGALKSWITVLLVISFCAFSFYYGQHSSDMNFFAASGAVMTVFGLFSMIRFTTIEKYLRQDEIVAASTGVTGPPLSAEESARLQRQSQEAARIRIKKELHSELKGISLTIIGTLIWAYGAYVPVLTVFKST